MKNHSISQYLNARAAHSPRFTSDNRGIVYITDISGVPQVWQVDNSTKISWPDQLTFGTERIMGVWPSPVPGDSRLIYARDVGGNENAQLFLLPASGAPDTLLTAGYENSMHLFGEWSEDGSKILYAANRRDPGLFDLYLQPLGGQPELVWKNEKPGYLNNLSFSPGGRRVIVTRMSSSYHHDLIEVDLLSGEGRLISPSTEQVRYHAVSYAMDGKALFINTDQGSDFLFIGHLDLLDGSLAKYVSIDRDVTLMTLSPDGRYLAYDINRDGASELNLLDLTIGVHRKAPDFSPSPGVTAWWDNELEFSSDSAQLAFSFTSSTRTSDIYVWDLKSDLVQPVTRSSHGGVAVDSFIRPELIHYATFDRLAAGSPGIPAWFYRSTKKSDRPMPVIVYVHGGPESQFRPYFNFLIQYFVQTGYAVLATNVRGSTGYGKCYSHLDDVEKRMDSVKDLAHAVYWLKDQPEIDGQRVVVYGGSYGGFMVLSALATYPELWAAGVDIVGISNFVSFLENTSGYRRAHREAEYGSLESDREFLERISPLNHADKITAPLIVIHGANDPRVPLSEAEQLVDVLAARGVPVEFLVFDDEGHGLAKLKNKQVAYPAIVDFLDKYLQ